MVSHVSRQAIAVRSLGVAALGLCYVAAGWYDAYFNFELRVWDVAAGAVLIEEAGGQISTLDGGPIGVETRTCLASNGLLHQLLRDEYASVIWRP
jgi:myo-inositol-1(or 4)-monophosphatase